VVILGHWSYITSTNTGVSSQRYVYYTDTTTTCSTVTSYTWDSDTVNTKALHSAPGSTTHSSHTIILWAHHQLHYVLSHVNGTANAGSTGSSVYDTMTVQLLQPTVIRRTSQHLNRLHTYITTTPTTWVPVIVLVQITVMAMCMRLAVLLPTFTWQSHCSFIHSHLTIKTMATTTTNTTTAAVVPSSTVIQPYHQLLQLLRVTVLKDVFLTYLQLPRVHPTIISKRHTLILHHLRWQTIQHPPLHHWVAV